MDAVSQTPYGNPLGCDSNTRYASEKGHSNAVGLVVAVICPLEGHNVCEVECRR